jgi:serine/threonine protein kinase, bacterial
MRPLPLSNGAIFAGFKIVGLLRSGGMGEVIWPNIRDFRGRTPSSFCLRNGRLTGSTGAGSVGRPNLASTLWHPHIVGVHDGARTTASYAFPWTSSTA